MPDAALTDAELVLLSLLCEGPMHGYELEQQITRRNMRAWTDLATSSIYYVLKRLEDKGFIEQLPTPGSGTGVPRKTYQITPGGEQVWRQATLQALARPSITYTNFLMGLHNLWNIPPGEALEAVRTYRAWLQADLQRQRDELEELGVSFFPLDVLFEYGFVLGEAELGFLEDLIGRLGGLASAGPGGEEASTET
jgi:DNA-binding PadR family transcriptional regulator